MRAGIAFALLLLLAACAGAPGDRAWYEGLRQENARRQYEPGRDINREPPAPSYDAYEQERQRLQKEADGEFIRLVTPYVPVRTGALRGSARQGSFGRSGPGATSADACRLFDPLRRRMSAPSPGYHMQLMQHFADAETWH